MKDGQSYMNQSAPSGFAEEVFRSYTARREVVPTHRWVAESLESILGTLFPERGGPSPASVEEVRGVLAEHTERLRALLEILCPGKGAQLAENFGAALPSVFRSLLVDAGAILAGDPAAESLGEVLATYPGFLAIAVQRLAHVLYGLKVPILPRMMTEYAHTRTGIDIHPGARIGAGLCIDHGTGIVIGETAVLGAHVKLYQGVTLGALSVAKSHAQKKRHPTLEDRVTVYAGATILGGETVIGADSVIGGNVWVVSSVPSRSVVYHQPEQVTRLDAVSTGDKK